LKSAFQELSTDVEDRCLEELCNVADSLARSADASASAGQAGSNASGSRTRTQKQNSRKEVKTILSVDSWSDIGFGIDGNRGIWVISPCPDDGGEFRKADSKRLQSKRNQLKKVLEVFANSPDGKSARVGELITALGFVERRVVLKKDEEGEIAEGEFQLLKTATSRLTGAMSDLSRQVRTEITLPKESPGMFRKERIAAGDVYISKCRIRFIIADEDGRLQFRAG
jgi:hypothetical protein